MAEQIIAKDKLLTTLNVLPKEFIISFDVYAQDQSGSKHTYGWAHVLQFRMGTNPPYKYGDRIPDIFYHSSNSILRVYFDSNGKKEYKDITASTYKWHTVRLVQMKDGGVFHYSIWLNGAEEYSIINSDPQDFKSVKVYAASYSFSEYPPQKGKLRNLIVQTKGNAATTPIIMAEQIIAKDKLLTTLNVLPKEFIISFDFYAQDQSGLKHTYGWAHVLQFRMGTNPPYKYGDRIPDIFYHSSNSILRVYFDSNGKKEYKDITASTYKWHTVRLVQKKDGGVFHYSIWLNGAEEYSIINSDPQDFKSVKVYAASYSFSEYPPQKGKLRNLIVQTKGNAEEFRVK